ncbi:hypothetical protein M8J75_004603 [Diaphorina citri]|nr:hypothetical protein M8J75_004603 [Diaphorina citri]
MESEYPAKESGLMKMEVDESGLQEHSPSFWRKPVVSEDVKDCTELFLLLYSSNTIQNMFKNKAGKQINVWIKLAQLMEENGHPIPSSSCLDAGLKAKRKLFSLKKEYFEYIQNLNQTKSVKKPTPKYFSLLEEIFGGRDHNPPQFPEDTPSPSTYSTTASPSPRVESLKERMKHSRVSSQLSESISRFLANEAGIPEETKQKREEMRQQKYEDPLEQAKKFWAKPVASEDVEDCTELILKLYSTDTVQNLLKNKEVKLISAWMKLAQLMEENGHPIPSSSRLDAAMKAERKINNLRRKYVTFINIPKQTGVEENPTPKYFNLLEETFSRNIQPQFSEDILSPNTCPTSTACPTTVTITPSSPTTTQSTPTKSKCTPSFWTNPVVSEDVEDCTELFLLLYSSDTVQNLLKNKEVKQIRGWIRLAQLMEENGHPIPSSSRLDAALKAKQKFFNLKRKYVNFIKNPKQIGAKGNRRPKYFQLLKETFSGNIYSELSEDTSSVNFIKNSKQTGVEENPTPKYFNLLEETFSRNIHPQFSEDILSPNTCPTSTACPTTVTITPSSPTTTQPTPTKSKCTPSFWTNPVVSEDVEDCTELFLLLYSSDTIQNLLKNKEVKQIRAWIRLAQLMEENGHPIPSSSRLDAALKAKQKFFNLKRKYVNFIKNPKQIGAKGNRRPKYFQLLKETFSGNIYSELSEDTSSVNFIKNPKQTGARGNRRPKYFHLRKETFSGNSELSEDTLSPNTCPTSTTCPTTVAITPSTPTTTYLATTQSTATKPRYILPLTESTSTKHPSKVTIITIPTPTTTCSTTTQPATHTILSLPSSPSQSELLRERGLSLKISSQLSEIKNMLLANEAARARERRQDREERRKEREMRIIEKERERREQQVFQTKLLEILSILGTERKSRPRSRSRSSRSRSRSRRSRRSSSRSKSECLVQEDESTNVKDEGLVQEYEVFVQEDEGMAQKHESLNQEGLIQNYEGPNQEDLVQEDEGPNKEDLVRENEGPNQEDLIQEDEGPNQEDLIQEDEGPNQEDLVQEDLIQEDEGLIQEDEGPNQEDLIQEDEDLVQEDEGPNQALVQKDGDEVLVQKDESPNQKDEGLVEESQGLNLRRSCRKILSSKREEWNLVYSLVYSSNIEDMKKAYRRLFVWKTKVEDLPAGVECTLGILQVRLREMELSALDQRIISHEDLQLIFLNMIAELEQGQGRSQSTLYYKAQGMDIPSWIVNLRHDAAHSSVLPPLHLLKSAAEFIFTWLNDYYWKNEAEHTFDYYIQPLSSVGIYRRSVRHILSLLNIYLQLVHDTRADLT